MIHATSSARYWRLLSCCITTLMFLLEPHSSLAGSPPNRVRRILILNEVGTSYPLTNLVDQGIRTAVATSPLRIEFYREYLDNLLFPDAAIQQQARDLYLRKYEHLNLDVVITVGPAPLKFMVEVHRKYFPGVPVIFCIPNGLQEALRLDSDFTGVEDKYAFDDTVVAALRLLPDTNRVVVVGGSSEYDRQQQALARGQLKPFEDHLSVSYLTNQSMEANVEELKRLQKQTIVLVTPIAKDAAGVSFTSSESAPILVAASNVPIFSASDRFFGHGEVGGRISSAAEQGRLVGEMALLLLKGEQPQNLARIKDAPRYEFDWRALQRWRLDERRLPAGSVVINRRLTVWQAYRRYIIAGISLLIVQTLLIVGLLWQRAQRRKTEATLGRKLIEAHEEERTRIGRELHDDINQRLALLIVQLDQCTPGRSLDATAIDSVRDISRDIETLSHRLHSSKLEYLGLAAAANAFCVELSRTSNVEVAFSHSGLPSALAKEVSLCLFRVMQEALQNAVKYSGARAFRVRLRGTRDSVVLIVNDKGIGFDPRAAVAREGIGLVSMNERLRMVDGELKVKSRPRVGTTIYARVPLNTA